MTLAEGAGTTGAGAGSRLTVVIVLPAWTTFELLASELTIRARGGVFLSPRNSSIEGRTLRKAASMEVHSAIAASLRVMVDMCLGP